MARARTRVASIAFLASISACGLGVDFDRYARDSAARPADGGNLAPDAAPGVDGGVDADASGGSFCARAVNAAFCTEFSDEAGWTRKVTSRCGSTCELDLVASPAVVSPPTALHARVANDGAGHYFALDLPRTSHRVRVELSLRADEVGNEGAADVLGLRIGPELSDQMGELRVYLNPGGTLSLEEDSFAADGGPVYLTLPSLQPTIDLRGRYFAIAVEIAIDDAGGGTCSLSIDGNEMVPSCRLSDLVRPGYVSLSTGIVFAQKSNAAWSVLYDDLAVFTE